MFKFEAENMIPQFIRNDKNGHAVAKAIEAAMNAMNGIIEDGVKCLNDYDDMPEWRLDELAWETNCLYDYSAGVDVKREWIRNAIPIYRLYGTPAAISRYLRGYFGAVDVEEGADYGGEAYHFRVSVAGDWTPENEAWARKAIDGAKSVRSVLDELRAGHRARIGIRAEGMIKGRFGYPMTGTEMFAGTWPEISTRVEIQEKGSGAAVAGDTWAVIQYKMCGAEEIG